MHPDHREDASPIPDTYSQTRATTNEITSELMHYRVHCGLVDVDQCTDFSPDDFLQQVNLLFLVCEHDVGASCTANNTKGDELGRWLTKSLLQFHLSIQKSLEVTFGCESEIVEVK